MDTQGRVIKKLIDNGNNDSVDRAEIYTLDVNGLIRQADTDISNDGTIDSRVRYQRDALGNPTIVESNSNATQDDIYESKVINEFDVYGNVIKLSGYAKTSDTPLYINTYRYDANGRKVYSLSEDDGDGILDRTDNAMEYTYDEIGRMTSSHRLPGGKFFERIDKTVEFDSSGHAVKQEVYSIDRNSAGEIIKEKLMFTMTTKGFDPVWDKPIAVDYDNRSTPIETQTYQYDAAGRTGFTYRNLEGFKAHELHFTGLNGEGNFDQTVNMTEAESEVKLNAFANSLKTMVLSQARGHTDLTLDKAVISQIVSKTDGLTIMGDATDTVNLKGFTDAEKLTATVSKGGQVYDQYQFADNGTTYTVLVDTDIHVTLG